MHHFGASQIPYFVILSFPDLSVGVSSVAATQLKLTTGASVCGFVDVDDEDEEEAAVRFGASQ